VNIWLYFSLYLPVDGQRLGVGIRAVRPRYDNFDVWGFDGGREGDGVVGRNVSLKNVGEEVAVVRSLDANPGHLTTAHAEDVGRGKDFHSIDPGRSAEVEL